MNQIKSTTPVSFVGKHTFTAEEKDQRLQQMLAAMRQKEEIEAEFKTTKSNYKSKIDAKDAEIKLSSNLLNAGFEDRTFSCYLVKNFETLKREYYEIGSNVLVGTEPLTSADHQIELQMTEDAIKANNEQAEVTEATIVQLTPEQVEGAEAGPQVILAAPIIETGDSKTEPHEDEVHEIANQTIGEEVQEEQSEPEIESPFDMGEPDEEDDSDPFRFDDI